jgi:hypothetical protein
MSDQASPPELFRRHIISQNSSTELRTRKNNHTNEK